MLAAKGSLRHFIFNELRVITGELLVSTNEWVLRVQNVISQITHLDQTDSLH
jgi:hypothetical protein